MHLDLIVRRAVVLTGAALSLVAGALAVRTAADWAVAAATRVEPPPGIIELQARIEAADAKAAAIRAQIDRLAGGSERLAELIDLADALAVTDGDAADALRAELDQAREALAGATPAPAPAATRAPAPMRTTTRAAAGGATAPPVTTATAPRDDDDDDDHHDEVDDD